MKCARTERQLTAACPDGDCVGARLQEQGYVVGAVEHLWDYNGNSTGNQLRMCDEFEGWRGEEEWGGGGQVTREGK